jgi:hypothetical protein
MTCIATRPAQGEIRTKKQLKEMAETDAGNIIITDPSIFAPRSFRASDIAEGQEEVVTNHPRRSWFAQIGRKNGKLYVK